MALTHVIAYDISGDRRRARVAAVLQAYGDRVQRSVFIATAGEDMLREAASARHAGKQPASTVRQQ